ncbi:MAG: hypothetical protein K1X88_34355, partial [Nannocystaceae bacterium]|nr:hypothetical protein [Nannocystaceae bacterium]
MSTPTPEHERPWAPAELDALEDRLEASASEPAWPVELPQASRDRIVQRLASYRAIERHAQALLTAEPPADVIARVLQAARSSDAAVPIAAPSTSVAPAASWWRRMWFVPALATAGAAALAVIVVMQAPGGPSSAASEPTVARNVDVRTDAAQPRRPTLAEQGAIAASETRKQAEGSDRGAAVVESARSGDDDQTQPITTAAPDPAAAEEADRRRTPTPEPAKRSVGGAGAGLGGAARGDA